VLLALNEGKGDGSSTRLSNYQFRRRTAGALVTAGRCGCGWRAPFVGKLTLYSGIAPHERIVVLLSVIE
jgi:hypothetical protein